MHETSGLNQLQARNNTNSQIPPSLLFPEYTTGGCARKGSHDATQGGDIGKLLEEGKTTTFDVVRLENDYAAARSRELAALANHRRADLPPTNLP
jgi:hypothetical protein